MVDLVGRKQPGLRGFDRALVAHDCATGEDTLICMKGGTTGHKIAAFDQLVARMQRRQLTFVAARAAEHGTTLDQLGVAEQDGARSIAGCTIYGDDEFDDAGLRAFLLGKGVDLKVGTPGEHETLGHAEQSIKQSWQACVASLRASRLPTKFWPYALNYVIEARRVTVRAREKRAVDGRPLTPAELGTGETPQVPHTFGALACITEALPGKPIRKGRAEDRGRLAIYLGPVAFGTADYGQAHFWCLDTQAVVRRRSYKVYDTILAGIDDTADGLQDRLDKLARGAAHDTDGRVGDARQQQDGGGDVDVDADGPAQHDVPPGQHGAPAGAASDADGLVDGGQLQPDGVEEDDEHPAAAGPHGELAAADNAQVGAAEPVLQGGADDDSHAAGEEPHDGQDAGAGPQNNLDDGEARAHGAGTGLACPAGHTLQLRDTTVRDPLRCDGPCGGEISPDLPSYSCTDCDFDLCVDKCSGPSRTRQGTTRGEDNTVPDAPAGVGPDMGALVAAHANPGAEQQWQVAGPSQRARRRNALPPGEKEGHQLIQTSGEKEGRADRTNRFAALADDGVEDETDDEHDAHNSATQRPPTERAQAAAARDRQPRTQQHPGKPPRTEQEKELMTQFDYRHELSAEEAELELADGHQDLTAGKVYDEWLQTDPVDVPQYEHDINKLSDRDARLWNLSMAYEWYGMAYVNEAVDTQTYYSKGDAERLGEPIQGLWAFVKKQGGRLKSRYAARGDLEEARMANGGAAPTISYALVFLLVIWGLSCGFIFACLDCPQAYLKAELPGRRLFLRAPKCSDLPPGTYLEIKRAIYGLYDSGRSWYEYLVERLRRCDLRQSEWHPCIWYNDDIMLGIFVDDLVVMARDDETLAKLREQLEGEGVPDHL